MEVAGVPILEGLPWDLEVQHGPIGQIWGRGRCLIEYKVQDEMTAVGGGLLPVPASQWTTPQGEGLGVVIHPEPSEPPPAPDSCILEVLHFCIWVKNRAWVETDERLWVSVGMPPFHVHTEISPPAGYPARSGHAGSLCGSSLCLRGDFGLWEMDTHDWWRLPPWPACLAEARGHQIPEESNLMTCVLSV